MPFTRRQYSGLILCLILLILGFLLLSGPENGSQEQFNEEVFSFRRITLAPILILAAYSGMIGVIMKKQKKTCPEKK